MSLLTSEHLHCGRCGRFGRFIGDLVHVEPGNSEIPRRFKHGLCHQCAHNPEPEDFADEPDEWACICGKPGRACVCFD